MSQTEETALVTFDALPLGSEVRRAIDELGYTHPTPVQRAVFEPAKSGRDLVVQARTGTGKTAAFGLPLVDSLVKKGNAVVQAMVLTPTRELALQVARELTALSKHKGTQVVAVYGGAPMGKQIEQLRDGAQILCGTPGRVLDHLRRGTLDASSIRVFILDESDEMLSMGFLPQITEIMGFLPEQRQILLFSATLPPDIRRIAETRLKNPEYVTLSGDHIGALEIQHFVYMTMGDKVGELVSVIETENPESAIVFCNTRDDTKRVASSLQAQGYAADWLNADLSQNERESVMARTRQSELRFLVCTDVAARGIDISHLTHVINFDFPESTENYVHRTGRTGRAGKTGTAISLIAPSNIGNLYLLRLTYKIRPIERHLPSARERKSRAEADLVQVFVEMAASRDVHSEDLALARRLLTHETAERVVASLLRDHLGARPDAAEEATAARRARPPTPVAAAKPAAPEKRVVAQAAPAVREERRPERVARDELPRRSFEGRAEATPSSPEPREVAPRSPEPREVAPRSPEPREVAPRSPEPREVAPRSPEPREAALRSPEPREAVRPARRPQGERTQLAPARTGERRPRSEEHRTLESARLELPAEPPPEQATEASLSNTPAPESGETGAEPVREIFVNVGRRDGAKPSDFQLLLESNGIPTGETDYIRVRHSHAFVGVRSELIARAVEVLNGAQIAGQTVTAEPARRR